VKYIPNLRICVTVCGSTIFSFLHPEVSYCLPKKWMMVFASLLGIRKGIFHGTSIWVHIGDMVAYNHPSLCIFENIVVFWRILCLSLRRQPLMYLHQN
jgi:hypothetical protein